MNFNDLKGYFEALPDMVMEVAPEIIADTATEYFKERFTEKAYDGNPWKEGKPKRTGSLLVDSGALLNSIRPVYVGVVNCFHKFISLVLETTAYNHRIDNDCCELLS